MEAPEFFQGGSCRAGNLQFETEKRNTDSKSGENFVIEDLLNFSNEESVFSVDEEGTADVATRNSTYSSTVNSSSSVSDPHSSADREILADANFSGDLCVPYDELAELEWLSNFVEESFSSEDLQRLELISGMKSRKDTNVLETREFSGDNGRNTQMFRPDVSVPGKARSKRSRAASSTWSSRPLVLSPSTSSSSENDVISPKKRTKPTVPRRKDETAEEGRKCLHCATEKTPQWRTGPMGPKTLCNACGVRYKSGRLVPEYRPAASPTFVMTRHSNSHRKVMELRRQKELQQQQQLLLEVVVGDEYLIRHHHSEPDFRRLI